MSERAVWMIIILAFISTAIFSITYTMNNEQTINKEQINDRR